MAGTALHGRLTWQYSIASAPGEPLAIPVERWWGLEAMAYLYIAFVAVLSVIAAVHAGRPQAHRRTYDRRSATSATGSLHYARHEPTPQPPHTD